MRLSGFRPRRKAIARPAHSLYQPILAVVIECFAQTPDMDIDGALLDVHIATPNAVEQLLATVDPLRVRHKKLQQPVLGRSDGDRTIPRHDAMPGTIERQVIYTDQLGFILAAAAPQHRIHSRYQLTRREWLGHVVVGAAVQPGDLIDLLRPRGQHDDRQVAGIALALERARELEPAVVWQHPVDQDQVGPAIGQRRSGCATVLRLAYVEAGALQAERDHL